MMEKTYVTKALLPDYEEYCKAIKPLWDSHSITNMGQFHKQLKVELKEYLKVDNISLFCNGHMALELALQAMELKGEVITTPFTFVSTTHAIVRNGLTPVFCDIEPNTYTIDVEKIEELITEKTCAILPVHVYGHACDIEKIEKIAKKYNLKVIYDAAHAFGVDYNGKGIGRYGDASMFSFHATKVFNTIEGGAISFSDENLDKTLYYLKNFGIKSQEEVEFIGSNAKMNEFSAIMGICNLKQTDEAISERKRVYNRYKIGLQNIKGIKFTKPTEEQTLNYAYVPIVIEDSYPITRDELFIKLAEKNIFARKYFYPAINELECYEYMNRKNETPIATDISKRILTLPIYPNLEDEIIDEICSIIKGLTDED